jgi:uncharacterized membrane protein
MPLEPGLIAYAGLASLAAARSKHWPARRLPAALSPSIAKAAGVLLLLLSSVIAFQRFGAGQSAVAWTGQLCVAGVTLVLLMSWKFDTALKLGILALALALLSIGSG